MLVYSFTKNVVSNKGMYILLNAQVFKLLQNERRVKLTGDEILQA
jgi:hypothetical protein